MLQRLYLTKFLHSGSGQVQSSLETMKDEKTSETEESKEASVASQEFFASIEHSLNERIITDENKMALFKKACLSCF